DVRERYIFRPTVLRSFGWKIIDVLSHDWLRAPQDVLNRIEALLRGEETAVLPEPEPAVEPEPVEDAPPPTSEATLAMREFTFGEGNSNKFWRIAVTDAEVVVNFGRIGTKGQTLIKALESPERAAREAEKLIAEKVRKGYQEQTGQRQAD
ncbi:WGR domain-containing protein, partial [Pseudomonas tolaasii]